MEVSILDEMVEILGGKDSPDDLKHYLTCVCLFGSATISSSVRAKVLVPTDKKEVPANVYVTAIAGSGLSKSRSLGYVENLFIKEASEKIKKITEAKIETLDPFDLEEITKLSGEGVKLSLIFKSATDSAVSAVRSMMDKFGVYSVNIALDELGSVLTKEFDLLSDTLLNAYDHGVLKPNLRRTTGVSVTESPVPHNLLMFGSPTLIFEGKTETEKAFYELMGAGMLRRSIFADVSTKTNHYTLKMDSEMESRVKVISNRMVDIVDTYYNKTIPFSAEASLFYEKYEIDCKIESEDFTQFDTYRSVYTQNKHWLSLKTSGVIAMLDMSDTIEMKHLNKAISIIEDSFKYMESITNRVEKYELVVDYLLDKGTEESEYTLTKELSFYKDVKSKRQFLELMRGYSYDNNITFMTTERHNVVFYSAKGREKVDLDKPLAFSYSVDITKDYFTNDDIVWKDFHKVVCSDKGICYSAHSFKDGYRKADNAIEGFSLIILDFDEGSTIDMAKVIFQDYTYLISTTKSHLKEKNGKVEERFRVILPMSNKLELDKEQYSQFYRNILEDLPIQADNATKDISRFYYSAGGEHWYNDGEMIDATKYIPNTQEAEIYEKEGTRLAKKNIDGIGQYILRNQHNGRNNSLAQYGLLLMDKGYTHDECKTEILRLNKQFHKPLAEIEITKTVFKTIERKQELEVEDDEDVNDGYEDIEDPFMTVDR